MFPRDTLLNRCSVVTDLVKLFEDAFKQQPDNDEFGRQAFFANVRTGNWKAAQLVSLHTLLMCSAATLCGQLCLPGAPLLCNSSTY
jgi:hypothetical protein